MTDKIKIDKTANAHIEGRLKVDIETVKKRFGGKMTENGLTIPLENIKVHKSEDGTEYVWLPFKGDGVTAEISIPLKNIK